MLKPQNWVEALKVNPKKLNEWSALAPEGIPMLVWCIQEGHVSATEYLIWASEHFQLPIVRHPYFEEAFQSETALHLHKNTATSVEWTPWFFPVEQWDNVTLVACVEPPSDFNDPNFRCVLADARMLKEAWQKFMAPTSEGSSPAIEASEVPIGMDPDSVMTQVKPFKLSLDNLEGDNIFKKMEPDLSQVYSGQTEEPAAPPAPAPAPTPKAKPVAAAPPLPVFEDDIAEGSAMHTGIDLSTISELPAEPEPERAPTAPIPSQQPKPYSKPVTQAPATASAAAKKSNYSPAEQDQIVEETFTQLRHVYKNCFLMRCEDEKAKLFKWDSTMMPNNGGQGIAVDLAFPTFFRILHKTNLPYHGYLVDSPAHRNFFNELRIKDLPGCVTAIPIKTENALVGVLVCIGDEPLQKLDMLKKTEDAAAKLIEVMAPSWSAKAAA